jgi:hypothetical protein
MERKFSLMIIHIEDVNPNYIKFKLYGDRTGRVKTHCIPAYTNFDYDKFSAGWYLVQSENRDSIWMWLMAWPLDFDAKIF